MRRLVVLLISASTSMATWKDINTKFQNDWGKTEKYCQDLVLERGGDLPALLADITQIHEYLSAHPYSLLGSKTKPPSGY